MSQRVLITTALAFGAGFAVASVPSLVPGGDDHPTVEHREVRRTVRRVRHSEEPGLHDTPHHAHDGSVSCEEHEAERERREQRAQRAQRAQRDPRAEQPTQTVQLDRGMLYEQLGSAGRALAHRGADGNQDGYRISAIRPASIGERLGLHNGDIVTHVGGIPLTSMDRAIEAWQAAQHASEVTLQLIRAGRTERIVVQLS